MPENIIIAPEVAAELQGKNVSMDVPPELREQIFGNVAVDELEAVLTPVGVVVAFELTLEEARAISHGNRQFFIHFLHADRIPPFRFVFEQMPAPHESNGHKSGDVIELIPDSPETGFSEPDSTD